MRSIETLGEGWKRLFSNWRAIGAFSLFAWLCATALLMPLSTWILSKLAVNDDVIISNYSVPLWLLSPQGITCLLLVGTMSVFMLILYIVGLFSISASATSDIKTGAVDAMRRSVACVPHLLHLSFSIFAVCVPAALIIAAGPGLLFLLLLRDHDINYYLSAHPPEFIWSIIISCFWGLIWGIVFAVIILRMVFVIPFWLKGVSPRQAVKMSWSTTRGEVKPVFMALLSISIRWLLLIVILHSVLFFVAGFVMGMLKGSVAGTVTVVLTYGVITFLADSAATAIFVSWGVCSVQVLYKRNVEVPESQSSAHDPVPEASGRSALFKLKLACGCLAALVVASALGSAWVLGMEDELVIPLVIAHRAGAADAPENSLSAMQKVVSDGAADSAEIDVIITLDGELVVAHDSDLMRLAGDSRAVRETSYEQLRTIDIGSTFSEEFRGERLALLDDFLSLAKGKMGLMIEFKHGKNSELVEKTISTVRAHGMVDEVVIISLELEEIRKVQKLAPEISVGYLASINIGDLSRLNVDSIGAKDGIVNAGFIDKVNDAGVAVYAWTIDDPHRMVELMEAGVNGLITNDPVLAREMVERVKALPPSVRALLKFRRFWDVFNDLGWWDI